MITAIVKAKIRPEKLEELRNIAHILQSDYAPYESGCLRYESFIDGDNFLTVEMWENQELLDIHLTQAHVKEYVPQMKACLVNGIFDVTFVHGGTITQISI